ncbi:hypothetical protein GCM10007940_13600 [Portibacter lacus]|uniref:Peptidase S8/S53 domain-containing protein n=2 Tax=Portibacter lacus TaxID=1099794 RepID=A0AA37SRQ4_9BACT|nr:hypothetical protein GCM10007940_13600 [Portibacter lacus]
MGTPLLAGVVSLMIDVNPCLTPAAIEEILVQTADPIPPNANSSITRAGKINAYAAVQMAQNLSQNKVYAGTQTIENDYISGDLTIICL